MKKYADLNSVVEFLDKYCAISGYSDCEGSYNGLQFENSGKVSRIATAVDAGINEIKAAALLGADLLLAHHGMFWTPPIPFVRHNYEKIKNIIDNDMAVYAVHLPLDAHPQIGNNILIAQALNLTPVGGCFEHAGKQIGVLAEAPKAGISELERRLKSLFPSTYKQIQFGSITPSKIAICSGSCGDAVALLPEIGVDTLICGELRQRHYTMAQELRLNLYPCGHYATECFGIMALGELLAKRFGLECDFIEMSNPL